MLHSAVFEQLPKDSLLACHGSQKDGECLGVDVHLLTIQTFLLPQGRRGEGDLALGPPLKSGIAF